MSAILCAGNIVYDILVRAVNGIEFGTTTWVDDVERSLGGNGANTSYTAAMLGVRVRLFGIVGTDPFGDELLRILAEAGVDLSHIVRCEAASATTIALVHSSGARAFLHRPGVSRQAFPKPMTFSHDVTAGFSHFHLANPYGLPLMRSHAAVSLQNARSVGLRTSLDTGWDARGEWIEVLAPCLPHVDILFVNEDEGRMLTGETEPGAMARFLRSHGTPMVVLKLGSKGCLVSTSDTDLHVPAFKVAAVDSTGAGDCFAGGFLAGLARAYSIEECARLANAAGALSIQQLGAVTGIRTLQETRDWMAQQKGC